MYPSAEQVVADFKKARRKFRRENNTPAKSAAFLMRAGIIEKHKKSPSGYRLVKELRSE